MHSLNLSSALHLHKDHKGERPLRIRRKIDIPWQMGMLRLREPPIAQGLQKSIMAVLSAITMDGKWLVTTGLYFPSSLPFLSRFYASAERKRPGKPVLKCNSPPRLMRGKPGKPARPLCGDRDGAPHDEGCSRPFQYPRSPTLEDRRKRPFFGIAAVGCQPPSHLSSSHIQNAWLP